MSVDKHRISRVTTGTGDGGESGLADGSRHPKHAPVFAAMGDLDELNAALGVLRSHPLPADLDARLDDVQQRLFDLGAELAVPGLVRLSPDDTTALEQHVNMLNDELPPLKEFVLPGGTPAAAWCHMTRTIARRAERHLVQLHHSTPQNPASIAYLNRLSDLLFVLARALNLRHGHPETLWRNSHG